jgi:hypothetical protein
MKPIVRLQGGRYPQAPAFSTQAPPPTDTPAQENDLYTERAFNENSLSELNFGLPEAQERRNQNDLDLFVF